MEALLIRYGLVAVFIGAATEGDVTMILAGVIAHLRLIDLATGIAVGAVGGCVADSVCYTAARWRADAIRRRRLYQRMAPFVERLAQRLGEREIAIARFVYGTRTASMLLWGIRELPVGRFLAWDAIGCALWATTLATLGFVFSNSAELLIGRVKRARWWLLVALVVAALVVTIGHDQMRRWRRRRMQP